jgi:diaminopimelate epimerase
MLAAMRLAFTKMQGLGNDFIVFEAPAEGPLPTAAALRSLANRRTGIGFDQALVLTPPRAGGTDVFYRIFNSDGSEVEQCANGARCIASLVARKLGRSKVQLDSAGGRIAGELHQDGNVSLDMGEPNFDPASLPFEASREADIYPLRVGEQELQIGAVSMGNPHAVIQVANVRAAPVDTLGPAVENHSRFPRRTNVGFMEVVSPEHIRLRVYERGAGETQACGTGACGAVAVGRRLGLLQETVQVDAPGGSMTVRWAGPGEHLWLTGPAVSVFEGTVDVPDDRESSQAEA